MTHRVDARPSISPPSAPSFTERVGRYFCFAPPQTLSDDITFFREALLEKEVLEVGSAQNSASCFSESSTLFGLISRLKKFIESPYQEFNISQTHFDNNYKQFFTDLIQSLETEANKVNTYKHHLKTDGDKYCISEEDGSSRYIYRKNGRYFVEPSEKTKTATILILNKIYQLKYDGQGYLNKVSLEHYFEHAPPLLQILNDHLKNLHLQLTKYPPNDRLIEKYFNDVKRSLSSPQDLIPHYTLTQEDKKIITHFQTVFTRHLSLPLALRKDERFFPSYYDLNKELLSLQSFISKRLDQSLSLGRKTLNSLESACSSVKNNFKSRLSYFFGLAENFAKQITSHSAQSSESKPHPLIVFYEALQFFSNPNCYFSESKKLSLFKELFQQCQDVIDNFAKDIKEHYAHLLSHTHPQNLTEENLWIHFDQLKQAVDTFIEQKTQNLPSNYSFQDKLEYLTHPLRNQDSSLENSPTKFYLKNIIEILNNPSGELLKTPIRFMITSFKGFLSHSIDKASEIVSDSDKQTLNTLKATAIQTFEKALDGNTIEGYKEAVSAFLKEYNKLQINLDCIELPAIGRSFEQETEDPQDIITSTLAKSKSLNYSTEKDIHWDEELIKQEKALSETATNYILFNLIYNTLLGIKQDKESEKTYYKIIEQTKSYPRKEDRIKAFLKELSLAVDKTPKNFLKKKLTKIILNNFIYSITYSKIDKFSKSVLDYIKLNVKTMEGTPYEPIKGNLIEQVNECISQYQLILEKWALDGGSKQRTIRKLIKHPQYNVGDKKNYSQEDLYKIMIHKASEIFVNGIDVIEPLNKLSEKYLAWYSKPIDATSSKVEFVFKKMLKQLSYSAYLVSYYSSYLVLSFLNKLINIFSYHLMKQTLEKTGSIENLFENIQEAIYKKNPYVDIITDFLVENLEDLDIAIYEKDQERRKTSNSEGQAHDSPEQVKIPTKVKTALKQALLNSFQLLEKNKHLTSDSLKKELTSHQSSLSEIKNIFKNSLEDVIIPKVVDSLIDVIVISSDVVLKNQQIDKQLAKLIFQVNQSLSTEEKSDEKNLKELNQIYFQNELRLSNLMDKIIKKMVTLSINDEFDRFGDRYYRETENQKLWIQSKLLGDDKSDNIGLVHRWSLILEEIAELNQLPTDLDQLGKLQEFIKTIKLEAESLLAEFSIKLEAVKDSSLSQRSVEKLYSQLLVLSKSLERFQKDYILKIYSNIEKTHSSYVDQANISFLNKAYSSLSSYYVKLYDEQNPETALDYLDKMHEIHEGLYITYQNFIENYHRSSAPYKENLDNLIMSYNSDLWQKSYMSNYNTIKEKWMTIKVLNMVSDEVDRFASLKKQELEKNTNFYHRLTHSLLSYHSETSASYTKILQAFDIMGDNECLSDIKNLYLKQIRNAKKTEDIDSLVHQMKLFISQYKEASPFTQSLTEIKDLLTPLKNSSQHILNLMENSTKAYQDEISTLVSQQGSTNVFHEITTLENIVKNLKSINHIQIPTGIVNFLKQQTSSLVYSITKPKADAAIDLIKDENFALFLINHLGLIPFAESAH